MKSPKELVQIARSLAYTRIYTHLINLRYTEIRDLKKEIKKIDEEMDNIVKAVIGNGKSREEIANTMPRWATISYNKEQSKKAIKKLENEINLINHDKFEFIFDEDKFLTISENILKEIIKQQALIDSI